MAKKEKVTPSAKAMTAAPPYEEPKKWKVQIRCDTAENWKTKNPVLLVGEKGEVSDSPANKREYRIGDGVHNWNELPAYFEWRGLVLANEVGGHRTVATLADLYKIADTILSASGTNEGNDAIGQEWHVVSEKKKYILADWAKRKTAEGWLFKPSGAGEVLPNHGEIFNSYVDEDGSVSKCEAGDYAHAEGSETKALGAYSHAEGYLSMAIGEFSHAECTGRSLGLASHSEGASISKGENSHSETDAISLGKESHAENASVAYGEMSHAEGSSLQLISSSFSVEGKRCLHLHTPHDINDIIIIMQLAEPYKIDAYRVIGLRNGDPHYLLVDKDIIFSNEENSVIHNIFPFCGGAIGVSSHIEGKSCVATNEAEHAQGFFNKSNEGTLDSIGIGKEELNENQTPTGHILRKNATETMSDGRHFILNIGGYDGTNPDKAKSVQTVIADILKNIGSGGGTGSAVTSVNGKTGAVVLSGDDIQVTYQEHGETFSEDINTYCNKVAVSFGYINTFFEIFSRDKQDKLVSGESIKTINGESILGKGNIVISGGSGGGTPAEVTKEAVERVLTGDIKSHNHATQLAEALSQYVKKVSGKDLSDENFTLVLKQKLEGLTNYNDEAVLAAIAAVNGRIDTLVGTSASEAIDTFKEIEAFLQGITDKQTLTTLLADLEKEITALIPTTLAQLKDDTTHRFVSDEEKAKWNKGGAPYQLPIANANTLGGVKPVAKTTEMSEAVGADEAGRLWTKPGTGGGGGKPSGGYQKDLYEALGAKWNGTHYELNGLTDITEEQMSMIYLTSATYSHQANLDIHNAFEKATIRTNFYSTKVAKPIYSTRRINADNAYLLCEMEVAKVYEDNNPTNNNAGIYLNSASNMFQNSKKLKKVIGRIILDKSCTNCGGMLLFCDLLESIELKGLMTDLKLNGTPNLDKPSILYMINNRYGDNTIAIKMEKSMYNKYIADGDVTKAAQAHNVTLVSL